MKQSDAPKPKFPTLAEIIPKSLDDIIRDHRDEYSLRLSIAEDFTSLNSMVSMLENHKQIRAIINEWQIVCFTHPMGKFLLLIGINETTQNAWATSPINSVDFENDLVLTLNSIYRLGNKGVGKLDLLILLHICACLHDWGFGNHLGVPRIFY
jgi:hypothetical protein